MSDAHAGSHDEKPGFFSNAVAVVAFIIVMAIVIWGLLHLVNLSTTWFASTFSPSRSTPTTNSPATMPTPVPTIVSSTQTTHTTSATPTPVDNTPVYRGPADIAVRIMSVSTGNPASVTFDIANVGGSSSGSYTFTAYLPTGNGGYVYSSPVQYALNQGDSVVNTLQFSQAVSGTITIIVHATDANAANNTASQSFIPNYQPQYQYPTYQYPQYPNYQSPYQQYDYYGHPYGEYNYSQYPYQYPYDYSQTQYQYLY